MAHICIASLACHVEVNFTWFLWVMTSRARPRAAPWIEHAHAIYAYDNYNMYVGCTQAIIFTHAREADRSVIITSIVLPAFYPYITVERRSKGRWLLVEDSPKI